MSQPVNVYWVSYHDDILAHGYWDNGLLDDLFKQGELFIHHEVVNSAFPEIPENGGGIFIINGRTHVEDTDKINADIAKLRWVLFIETGDEEALFPWREIHHPIMKVWIMLPRMNQHDDVSFHLPQGYRPQTRELLKEIGYLDKVQDWFFAGQVNHPRREQCIQELKYLKDSGESPNGLFVQTAGFGDSPLLQGDYLTLLARTKIALCPSGIETPDNFRLYEALEAGCVPVVDAFSSNFQTPGFWQYLFGDDIPFPIVQYWDELPKLMPELIADYPQLSIKCFAWWQKKKRDLKYKLDDDIKELAK